MSEQDPIQPTVPPADTRPGARQNRAGEASTQPTPVTPKAPDQPSLASITDFQKLVFRVGTILEAEDHPNADKLLVVKVDLGEATPRQLVAGIKASYQPADLIGKQVVVVANLKPAKLRGIESQGMILAATDDSGIVVLRPDRPVRNNSPVK